MILGLDTASRLVGYCVGDGATVPLAHAWEFDHCGVDLGALAVAFEKRLDYVCEHFGVTLIGYEAPIHRPQDKVLKMRKLYGLGWAVEHYAKRRGVPCKEVTVGAVKKELTGNSSADKAAMVAVALRCGLKLPRTNDEGKEDAADAFGVWRVLVRFYARQYQERWDRLTYSGRPGALL